MTVSLHQLFFLGLLTASAHWLVARSKIAAPLWSRASGWFDQLLRCPACSGFWLGLALWFAGFHVASARYRVLEVVVNGLAGVLLTPVFEGALLWGLRESTIERPDDPVTPAEPPDPTLTSTGEVTPLERPPQA